MSNTEYDLALMAQLSYIDLSYDELEKINYQGLSFSVQELAQRGIDQYNQELKAGLDNSGAVLSELERNIYLETIRILQQIVDNPRYDTWYIVKARNENNGGSGFVGYAIDTGDIPIVVSRGTEHMFKLGSDQTDMVDNLQLSYDPDTDQQMATKAFLDQVIDEKGYAQVDMTGHSKGGNNALYAAVMTEHPAQIGRCVVFNAPGFGTEFINKNQDRINTQKEKIIEIQNEHDIVSSLLTNIGNIVIVRSSLQKKDLISQPIDFENHGLWSILSKDKSALNGPSTQGKDSICQTIALITKDLEGAPAFALQFLIFAYDHIMNGRFEAADIGAVIALLISGMILAFTTRTGILARNIIRFVIINFNIIIVAIAICLLIYIAIDVMPKLIQGGLDALQAAPIAIMNFMDDLAQTTTEIITGIINAAVEMGIMAIDEARKIINDLLRAVLAFCTTLKQRIENAYRNIFNAIQSLWGSARTAIRNARDIVVMQDYIYNLAQKICRLKQTYQDQTRILKSATTFVNDVRKVYGESYVQNACRAVLVEIDAAGRRLTIIERELSSKSKTLQTAVDIFRQTDLEQARQIRLAVQAW